MGIADRRQVAGWLAFITRPSGIDAAFDFPPPLYNGPCVGEVAWLCQSFRFSSKTGLPRENGCPEGAARSGE